ncbi:DUF2961 domain-containing protein, partial [Paenibacillus sepulcri]|nr:DUF2961 domain-containing protein [Paenibacillus sepulcri]
MHRPIKDERQIPLHLGRESEGRSRRRRKRSKPYLYRWHLMDPIRFDSELRVTIQQ